MIMVGLYWYFFLRAAAADAADAVTMPRHCNRRAADPVGRHRRCCYHCYPSLMAVCPVAMSPSLANQPF